MNFGIDSPKSRVWVEIDLGQIQSNFQAIASAVSPLKVMAVLKADAYGLGVKPIAKALCESGAQCFGVAEIREALAILDFGLPVHILGGLIEDDVPQVVGKKIIAPITDVNIALCLSEESQRQGVQVECHYLIDTGMGRLGILPESAEKIIEETIALPGLHCTGIYSHFPQAYDDIEFSQRQIQLLTSLFDRLRRKGIFLKWLHIANSDGINNIPSSIQPPFTLVRSGINLYGMFDNRGKKSLNLKPVITLKTRLVAIRELPEGTTIGYGRTKKLTQPTKVGTIAIGYADGLPLAMSDNGMVFLQNRKCPILGRISMDYTTISLEGIPDPQLGDEVICLGGKIPVTTWAQCKKTNVYDIICSMGRRVERRYVTFR